MLVRTALILVLALMSTRHALAAGGMKDTLRYGSQPEQTVTMFYPGGAGPFPVIVFVHGGGWTQGKPGVGKNISLGMAPLGYAVASVDYRKPPAVSPRDTVSDVAAAVAYLRKNSQSLKLSPGKFALLAHSAGSQMVTLLATDPSYARAAGFDLGNLAVVGTLDGIFDLNTAIGKDAKARKRDHELDVFGNDPARWAGLSPVAFVQQGVAASPLYCVIHEDTVSVFLAQADEFAGVLKQAGKQVVETNMPGYSHGQLLGDFHDPAGHAPQAFASCLQQGGMGR